MEQKEKISAEAAIEIFEHLEEIERRVAWFYELCSQQFPQDESLWKEISHDEIRHAHMIQEMKNRLSGQKSIEVSSKLRLPVLKTFVHGIDEQIRRLESGGLPRKNAFFIARDLENTLFERRFHEAFSVDDPGFSDLIAKFRAETDRHYRVLEDYIKNNL